MEKIKFSKKEELAIAEYGFAYSSDTLIKSEAVDVLVVMLNHKMIDNLDNWLNKVERKTNGIAHEIIHLLRKNIPQEQRKQIVKDFQGDYISPLAEYEGL
jgi:antibiotic biosynthesis monooxygenase (ABM) superfamily enzyme